MFDKLKKHSDIIEKIFWPSKKETKKLLLICFFFLFLLIGQEFLTMKFDPKSSLFFYWQKKWAYNSAIQKGIQFYSNENREKLRIDDFFLLKQINAKKNLGMKLDGGKYAADPFRRLLDKKNPMNGLKFERNNLGVIDKYAIDNNFYTIFGAPKSFLTDPTDDVVLKSLYCDLDDYSDADFGILKLFNRQDGGYFDTHFLLSLLFLKNNHCYDEKKIDEQIQIATENVIDAEKRDIEFSDLYAERIVFLYWAGRGDAVEKEWVGKVKNSQATNFSWHDKAGLATDAHATGLAILSMIYYAEGNAAQDFY